MKFWKGVWKLVTSNYFTAIVAAVGVLEMFLFGRFEILIASIIFAIL